MVERSYGVIPVNLSGPEPRYMLVQHQAGHWGFPKGHSEPSETAHATARRELLEETGLRDCRINGEAVFSDQYHFTRDDQVVIKSIKYFLGYCANLEAQPKPPEIRAVRWVTRGEALDLLTFHSSREILRNAHSYLQTHDLNQWT